MRTRTLGSSAIQVGEIGLGCMPMNWAYVGDASETESIAVIHRALDLGMTLLDTSDVYGPFTNEELVGRALEGHRERAVVATKAGLVVGPSGGYPLDNDARPEHIREAVEGSLRRLRIDVIDLYQLHRIDPHVPLEESWGAMAELVARREGARARHVRGERRRAGASTRDPSRRVGPVGALAVVHRASRRRRAVVRRSRRRVHPVRAAGPRLPHRHADDRHDGPRRLPLDAPALHAGRDRREPGDRRTRARRRGPARSHARPGRARVGPGAGRARRPDPGHQTAASPRGERRRGRRSP